MDDCVIIDYRSVLVTMPLKQFRAEFKRYSFDVANPALKLAKDGVVKNFELIRNHASLYSFKPLQEVEQYLKTHGVEFNGLHEVPMSLEDAFIGITGKY